MVLCVAASTLLVPVLGFNYQAEVRLQHRLGAVADDGSATAHHSDALLALSAGPSFAAAVAARLPDELEEKFERQPLPQQRALRLVERFKSAIDAGASPSADAGGEDNILAGRVGLKRDDDSDALQINVLAPSPEAAAELADAVAQTLTDLDLDLRAEALASAIDAGTADVAALEAELGQLRQTLAATPLSVEAPLPEALADIDRQLTVAKLAASKASNRLGSLERAAADPAGLDRLIEMAPGSDLAWLRAERDQAMEHRARLLKTYGDRHPLMLAAIAEVAEIEAAIDAVKNALLAAAEADVEASTEQVRSFDAQRTAVIERRLAAANHADERAALERRAAQARERLDRARLDLAALEDRRNELRSPWMLDGSPNAEAQPRLFEPTMLFGGAGGVGLALGLVLAGSRARRAGQEIKVPEDVERATGLATLAAIDSAAKLKRSALDPEVDDRLQRLLLRLAADPTRPKIVALSGFAPSAVDLALAFATVAARDGERTLLVDGDVSKRALSRRCRAADKPGLAEDLMAVQPWRESLVALHPEGPWLVPAGTGPSVRSDTRLAGALRDMADKFDRVVLVTSAADTADGLRCARAADAVLLTVERGAVRWSSLAAAVDEMVAVQAPLFGTLFIGAAAGRRR